ncbi:hypothetical protein F7725_001111 [Dissostichus mawsoni]|uniref:Uncharacterized protein n=1 Tax=Dissostichus mawsoni TaxID=36200 RepID=A0A7J5ZGU6_DISMA|nr:hypothetical protein F7725_001111 [Dissostichus mawsoni]
MRFPLAGGGGSAKGQEQDIKERRARAETNTGTARTTTIITTTTIPPPPVPSLSSSHKHSSNSSGAVGGSKKVPSDSSRTSSSSSSASRKRTHSQEPTAGPNAASKVSKSTRNAYQIPSLSSSSGQTLGHNPDILPALGLSHQGSFSKGDKTDTNGHGAVGGPQSNEYQDTFEMLNSLLSAQGVQPAQPSMFDYRTQFGEYRFSGGTRGNGRPPPLPSEPPPQLPPLPK